jgi:hypothetical protein
MQAPTQFELDAMKELGLAWRLLLLRYKEWKRRTRF